MSERRMNWLERYRSYQELLTLPTFDTIEEAGDVLGRFLLHRAAGSFTVCTGYIGQVRDQDPKWTHREEFSFLLCDMYRAQQQAALAVGIELIGGPE